MSVAIVTDSAAALPADLADKHGVTVVPMWLTVRGVPVREGERPLEELVAEPGIETSGPAPGEFEEAIRAVGDADGVLVLTIAATMSSTHAAAEVAARAVGEHVRVLDTTTAAGAEGLVVLAAAEAAAAGGSLDDVEAEARRVMDRVRLVAMVPTLDHLVRSGRVPGLAGWAGRRLGLAPLFEFGSGRARPLRPALGADAALDRIVGAWRRSRPPRPARLHVAVLHALAPERAEGLLSAVCAEAEPVASFVSEFGSVMVVHTGAGLAGLAWWWDDAEGV